MVDRIAVWLLSLPLMLGGSAIAHWAAYRLVYPTDADRGAELAATGHGYLTHAPQALAVAGAMLVVAFAARVLAGRGSHGRPRAVSLVPFAALPPTAFALQEHLERLLHDGTLPLDTVAQPTFAVGLLLQLPFALVAFCLARLLLEAAERVACACRVAPPRARLLPIVPMAPTSAVLEPGASAIARLRPLRGPPPSLLARS